MQILIPVDGSEDSLRAVRRVAETREWYCEPPQVHLLNVQLPVASGGVKMFISQDQLNEFYQEEGEKALKPARDLLEGSGLQVHPHVGVGEPAQTITRYARDHSCDLVAMGTRGLGALGNVLLGSVAAKVIHLAACPVMLVK